MRTANFLDHTPRLHLARAAWQRECGQWELAADDLRRARDIATRGRMRLHLIPAQWRGRCRTSRPARPGSTPPKGNSPPPRR